MSFSRWHTESETRIAMVVVSVAGAPIAREALREFSLKGQSRAYLSTVCRTSDRRPMRGTQCSVPQLHFVRKFSAKICRIRLIGWLARGTLERADGTMNIMH